MYVLISGCLLYLKQGANIRRYCGNMGIQGNFGMEKRNKDPSPSPPWILEKKIVLACMKSAGVTVLRCFCENEPTKSKIRPRVQSTSQPSFGLSQKW